MEIVFTGLRPNEKLHEDLISGSEHGERRVHKLITHVAVAPLTPTAAMRGGEVPTFDEMCAVAMAELPDDIATGTLAE